MLIVICLYFVCLHFWKAQGAGIYKSILAAPNIPSSELLALHELYNFTDGEHWTWRPPGVKWNFKHGVNPCQPLWQGLLCTLPSPLTENYIAKINLFDRNLNGTIPLSIGDFKHLTTLELPRNFLYGSIPHTMGNLTTLTGLALESNNITGRIPESLSRLHNLQGLFVQFNSLTGPLPAVLGDLAALTILDVQDNRLTGTLPPELGRLSKLELIYATNNLLHGPIPDSFGNLTALVNIEIDNNMLSGTLPASMGHLQNLRSISLANNQFTGTFPTTFDSKYNIDTLGIYNNQFSGTLPQVITNSVNITKLEILVNLFSGTISAAFCNLSRLRTLDFADNRLTGTIPPGVCGDKVTTFDATLNFLAGTLPSELDRFSHLRVFLGELNMLTGSIPSAWCNLPNFTTIDVGANFLTGTIPACFVSMRRLQQVFLNTNQLTGTLPTGLGQGGANLLYVIAFENLLTGTIPDSLGAATSLVTVQLFENALTGRMPRTFVNISTLEVQNNHLSGTLEGVFRPSVQRYLASVQVSSNRFTGTLPDAVFRLPLLKAFVAGDNCFHGTLSTAVCAATQLSALVLDGMSSAHGCQKNIFPGLSSSYVLTQSVGGAIPACMFAMPQLHTLQLAGNGFTGSLPDTAGSKVDKLADLSLSHNQLTGIIPASVLQRSWYLLDLSYNRFYGSLPTGAAIGPSYEYNVNTTTTTLSLENNRLSGRIPGSLQQREGLSMLGTNVFSCRLDGSDLPQHDSDKSGYQCGSDSFNVPFYVWLGLLLLTAMASLALLRWNAKSSSHVMRWLATLEQTDERVAPKLRRFFVLMQAVLRLCACVTIFALIGLLPAYAALSHYHGTLLHQYAWTLSAGYLSGATAVAVEFTLWTLLTVLVLVAVRVRAMSGETDSILTEDSSSAFDQIVVHNMSDRVRFALYAVVYGSANIAVVAGANTAFVYVAIYQSSTWLIVAQILMSLFKLLWNNFGTEFLRVQIATRARATGSLSKTGLLRMQIAVALTNNIVIPCLVVACVSSDCFYEVFVPPAAVHATYSAPECLDASLQNCEEYVPERFELTYNPPFRYSYQCSSSFITYYAPAFVIMCMMSTFAVPVLEAVVTRFYLCASRDNGTLTHWVLSAVTPRLLQGQDGSGKIHEEGGIIFLPANRLLGNMFTYTALLLTFGATFPPLAVALLVAAAAVCFVAKVKAGRFLSLALATEGQGTLVAASASLDANCDAIPTVGVLATVAWMLVTVSCWFYTLFLFDTLGDAVGFEGAYWVLIVMPLMPLVLYCLYGTSCAWYAWNQARAFAEQARTTAAVIAGGSGDSSLSVELRASESGTFNALRPTNHADFYLA